MGTVKSTPPIRRRICCLRLCPAIVIQAFTLTFLAEWGDRSQITTIILAAREVCTIDVTPLIPYFDVLRVIF